MSALPLYLVLLLFLQLTQFIFSGSNGLTIRLIHVDSIESPVYPGNLTHEERITRIVQQSRMHVPVVEGKNKSSKTYQPEQIQPHLHSKQRFYLVSVGIGTFSEGSPYLPYFLKFDMSSTLIWTQCEGCEPYCFRQTQPLYPYARSSTYNPLPCNRRGKCGIEGYCAESYCKYRHTYNDLSVSAGNLATETFTFKSDTQVDEKIDLIMGCGKEQTGFPYRGGIYSENEVAGTLGIGKSSTFSFISQLGTGAKNKFSYCLKPWKELVIEDLNTLLKFGDDAKFGAQQEVTATTLYHARLPEYHLHLTGITIARVPLYFPRNSFELKPDGSGGVVIDVGAPFTSMHREHYDRVMEVLYPLFSRLVPRTFEDLENCYVTRRDMYKFDYPSMILHFGLTKIEVPPEQLFLFMGDFFCVAIRVQHNKYLPMVIGNKMQANYRFVYDLDSMTLSWASERCP